LADSKLAENVDKNGVKSGRFKYGGIIRGIIPIILPNK
jgi:hypothetical protein